MVVPVLVMGVGGVAWNETFGGVGVGYGMFFFIAAHLSWVVLHCKVDCILVSQTRLDAKPNTSGSAP